MSACIPPQSAEGRKGAKDVSGSVAQRSLNFALASPPSRCAFGRLGMSKIVVQDPLQFEHENYDEKHDFELKAVAGTDGHRRPWSVCEASDGYSCRMPHATKTER